MRHILATCLFLAIALPCQAQGDKPKPNTLTPKEIADGWILLFDGETTFGWRIEGEAKVVDGVLILGGDKKTTATVTTKFGYFEMRLEYRATQPQFVPSTFTWKDPVERDWQLPAIKGKAGDWGKGMLKVGPITTALEFPNGTAAIGSEKGPSALAFHVHAGDRVSLRNIRLRPQETKSLFNGKDLDGWKVFPKKKSEFAVIDGAINVKDGPGDLQTVGKYQDFVLQLDCISNGKHLNSGIFFRCRDNEYQNGYEAQIFNKFSKGATQKYKIEEYDPKTNKLIAEKEITSTAFDYGTGAIYRRVPARKEMSKDGEWFGMTIVAHGNHLATWVNGVQVVDWYDHRPKGENARKGCYLDGGHISIQGHDPTTNLSFKNFRIAELK